MRGLPQPPDAYWANIPWWGYLGFALAAALVMFVLAPWAIQRARDRPSAIVSREQSMTAREQAFEDLRRAEFERVIAERDAAKADAVHGWSLMRGWAAVAHKLRHDYANAAHQANDLLRLCHRIVDGKLSGAAAAERVAAYQPMEKPAPLPEMDQVEPKRPGETQYL